MYGTAIKCEECYNIEFISIEMKDDENFPGEWLEIRKFGVKLPMHFRCGECASNYISKRSRMKEE
jgi:hypothetical protein